MKISLEQYLREYANSFGGSSEEIDQNIQLKLEHTFCVRDEVVNIATAESFDAETYLLAERSALLHDLSRFEQFSRFRTYKDADSFDHGRRSAELAQEQGLLNDLDPEAQQDVLVAIEYHNKISLPEGLSERGRKLAGIVRDGDKIDIMRVLFEYLRHPDNDSVVMKLDNTPEISPLVWQDLVAGRPPLHAHFRTVADFLSSKLNWVYDLNYPTSRRIFLERNYLGTLWEFLPHTSQVEQVYQSAQTYLLRNSKLPEKSH